MPLPQPIFTLLRGALVTGLGLVMAGCASLSTTPPENYDLSGVWQLNNALSDSPALAGLNRKQQASRGGRGKAQGRPTGSRPGGGGGRGGGGRGGGSNGGGKNKQGGAPGSGAQAPVRGGTVQIMSLQATTIEIEQSVESMGMEFDGTHYRDVSWGERKRGELTVDSGWKDGDLIINSKGGRMPVVERYVLSNNGTRLTIYIELDGGRDDLSFKRVYEKTAVTASSE